VNRLELTDGETWGGRPIARKVVDAEPRRRLIATGLVVAAAIQDVGGSASARYTLDDGSGRVDLLFLGRRSVADLGLGACVTIEGTVMADTTKMVVWNPIYRVESQPPTVKPCRP
jgi:hypothetical protein